MKTIRWPILTVLLLVDGWPRSFGPGVAIILASWLLVAFPVQAADDNSAPTFPGVIPKPKEYQEHDKPLLLTPNDVPVNLQCFSENKAVLSAKRALVDRIRQLGGSVGEGAESPLISVGREIDFPKLTLVRPVPQHPQSYEISVETHPDGKLRDINVRGIDGLGTWYGVQTLIQLLAKSEEGVTVRNVVVRDWPTFTFRSFKGQCWYYRDNRMFVDWAPRFKWNVFGPCYTDCPDWRNPPAPYRQMIKDCCDTASKNGLIRIVQLGNPYMLKDKAIRASSDQDIDTLVKFFELSLSHGSDVLMLCLDDFAYLPDADAKRFKTLAGANVHIVNRFAEKIRAKHPDTRILVCPPPYWMPKDDKSRQYLRDFSAGIPKDIPIVWTGKEVTTTCHHAPDINAYQALLGSQRSLFLWDNTLKMPPGWGNVFRMNPFLADCGDINGSAWRQMAEFTHGEAVINTYGPAEIYKVPLMTAADFLWNPEAYDPKDSLRRALYWFDDNPRVGPMVHRWINDLHQKLYGKRIAFLKRPTAEDLDEIETLTREYRSLADGIARETKNARLIKTLAPYKKRHEAAYPYLAIVLEAYQKRSVKPKTAAALLDRVLEELSAFNKRYAKGDIAGDRDGLVRQSLETQTIKLVKALRSTIK